MNGVLPAKGDPTKAAMPWNSPTNPNAFVKDPRPSISTSIIDFRVINAAEINLNAVTMLIQSCSLFS